MDTVIMKIMVSRNPTVKLSAVNSVLADAIVTNEDSQLSAITSVFFNILKGIVMVFGNFIKN